MKQHVQKLKKTRRYILRRLADALATAKNHTAIDDLLVHPSQESRRHSQRPKKYLTVQQLAKKEIPQQEVNIALNDLLVDEMVESNFTRTGEEHFWLSHKGIAQCATNRTVVAAHISPFRWKALVLEPRSFQVFYGKTRVKGVGSGKTFRVLKELLRTKGLVKFSNLSKVVKMRPSEDYQKCEDAVREAIKQLKKALKNSKCPYKIQSQYGQGYFLSLPRPSKRSL